MPQEDWGGDAGQARASLPCRLTWVLGSMRLHMWRPIIVFLLPVMFGCTPDNWESRNAVLEGSVIDSQTGLRLGDVEVCGKETGGGGKEYCDTTWEGTFRLTLYWTGGSRTTFGISAQKEGYQPVTTKVQFVDPTDDGPSVNRPVVVPSLTISLDPLQ